MWVRGYVSTAFGCPYEGSVTPDAVVRVVDALTAMGCDEISIGDTIGVGTPNQVFEIVERVRTVAPLDRIALHFHDTRGTALANIVAALEAGVAIFDASSGGLGGCPYAPGATGNVATEDVLYMLHGMGIETGHRPRCGPGGLAIHRGRAASGLAPVARLHRARGGRENAAREPHALSRRRRCRCSTAASWRTTPQARNCPNVALDRMRNFQAFENAPKGGIFERAQATTDLVAAAKAAFAALIDQPVERVGIAPNATTGAMAFSRLLASAVRPGDRIVVTDADHSANVEPWVWLERFGATIERIGVDQAGGLDEAALFAAFERGRSWSRCRSVRTRPAAASTSRATRVRRRPPARSSPSTACRRCRTSSSTSIRRSTS